MSERRYTIPVWRNVAEYAAIVAWWVVLLALARSGRIGVSALAVIVVLGCWLKTALFGAENLRQLYTAARTDLAHHRFLVLMGINTSQMVLAYTFDFHVLHVINKSSFDGVDAALSMPRALFEFFYLSTLNFSFFGYGDILPRTVPAKIVNLTEIVLA